MGNGAKGATPGIVRRSMEDALRLARALAATPGRGADREDLSQSDRIRVALFSPAWQKAEDFDALGDTRGRHASVLRSVLKDHGYVFDQRDLGDGTYEYRMVNPEHFPTQEQFRAYREKKETHGRDMDEKRRKDRERKAKKAAMKKAAAAEPEPEPETIDLSEPETPAVVPPLVGSTVMVSGVMVDDKGEFTVAIRNGTQGWLTKLVGATRT